MPATTLPTSDATGSGGGRSNEVGFAAHDVGRLGRKVQGGDAAVRRPEGVGAHDRHVPQRDAPTAGRERRKHDLGEDLAGAVIAKREHRAGVRVGKVDDRRRIRLDPEGARVVGFFVDGPLDLGLRDHQQRDLVAGRSGAVLASPVLSPDPVLPERLDGDRGAVRVDVRARAVQRPIHVPGELRHEPAIRPDARVEERPDRRLGFGAHTDRGIRGDRETCRPECLAEESHPAHPAHGTVVDLEESEALDEPSVVGREADADRTGVPRCEGPTPATVGDDREVRDVVEVRRQRVDMGDARRGHHDGYATTVAQRDGLWGRHLANGRHREMQLVHALGHVDDRPLRVVAELRCDREPILGDADDVDRKLVEGGARPGDLVDPEPARTEGVAFSREVEMSRRRVSGRRYRRLELIRSDREPLSDRSVEVEHVDEVGVRRTEHLQDDPIRPAGVALVGVDHPRVLEVDRCSSVDVADRVFDRYGRVGPRRAGHGGSGEGQSRGTDDRAEQDRGQPQSADRAMTPESTAGPDHIPRSFVEGRSTMGPLCEGVNGLIVGPWSLHPAHGCVAAPPSRDGTWSWGGAVATTTAPRLVQGDGRLAQGRHPRADVPVRCDRLALHVGG